MPHRTLAAATAAALALALPAAAAAPPTTTGTWVPSALAPDVSIVNDHAAFAGGTGYVVGGPGPEQARGLWTTTDFARTWSYDPLGLPYAASYAFGTETEWWADSSGNDVRRTTDAGATWTTVPLPLASTERSTGVLVADATAGAYAVATPVAPAASTCATHDALLWTGDGGATWERHDLPSYASGGAKVRTVDVADADTAVVTAYNAVTGCGNAESPLDVYLTDDAGATWTRIVASLATGPQASDATVSPDGATVVVTYTDGTVRWSGDGGATFASTVLRQPGVEPLPDNLTGWLDAAMDVELRDGAAYVALSGGSIWRTTDGAAWTLDGLHGSLVSTRVAAFDADRAFSVAQGVVVTRV